MKVKMLKGKDLYYPGEIVEFPDDLARRLIEEGVAVPAKGVCPDCGSQAVPDGGCWVCINCGWSRCG